MLPFLLLSAMLFGFAFILFFAYHYIHPTWWRTSLEYRKSLFQRKLVVATFIDPLIAPKFKIQFNKRYKSILLYILGSALVFALLAYSMGAFSVPNYVAIFVFAPFAISSLAPYLYWSSTRRGIGTGMRIFVNPWDRKWWQIALSIFWTFVYAIVLLFLLFFILAYTHKVLG